VPGGEREKGQSIAGNAPGETWPSVRIVTQPTEPREQPMSDVETLKAEIKKLSAKAINAKMNLHDLSEELPVNWTSIMSVAQAAHDAFAALEAARASLKARETA
jgi:hypothetical protein